jgi:hypothetical protein
MDPAKDPTPGSGGRERGQHLLDPTYMTQERSAVASKFECSRILNFETQRPSVGQNEKVTYQPPSSPLAKLGISRLVGLRWKSKRWQGRRSGRLVHWDWEGHSLSRMIGLGAKGEAGGANGRIIGDEETGRAAFARLKVDRSPT